MHPVSNRLVKILLLILASSLAFAAYARKNDCWMTGGGSVFDVSGMEVIYDGRTTHGFVLHCDGRNPNNLQINWGGNHFHLTSLDGAWCFDDPGIEPDPPDADFDTFIGSGTGRYNGDRGFCAFWTFTDTGQPGVADTAAITITDCAGTTILDVFGPLNRGNHQAHTQY